MPYAAFDDFIPPYAGGLVGSFVVSAWLGFLTADTLKSGAIVSIVHFAFGCVTFLATSQPGPLAQTYPFTNPAPFFHSLGSAGQEWYSLATVLTIFFASFFGSMIYGYVAPYRRALLVYSDMWYTTAESNGVSADVYEYPIYGLNYAAIYQCLLVKLLLVAVAWFPSLAYDFTPTWACAFIWFLHLAHYLLLYILYAPPRDERPGMPFPALATKGGNEYVKQCPESEGGVMKSWIYDSNKKANELYPDQPAKRFDYNRRTMAADSWWIAWFGMSGVMLLWLLFVYVGNAFVIGLVMREVPFAPTLSEARDVVHYALSIQMIIMSSASLICFLVAVIVAAVRGAFDPIHAQQAHKLVAMTMRSMVNRYNKI